MERIALLGAGGKMGFRLAGKLTDAGFDLGCVEPGEAGRERLRDAGHEVLDQADALEGADVVVLAVPDKLIKPVAESFVPDVAPGTMVISLDPAAPVAGELPARDDITYFVTHPCHPSVFKDEADPAARRDHFGGVAKQAIVCALMQGPEEDYARGERIAKAMWAPVSRSHRISVEQMAILEPALAETVSITLLRAIHEAMEEAIARGVPAEAARDFITGHLGVELAIVFGEIDAQFSDGALKAAERAASTILQPDWKDVFKPESIRAEIKEITRRE